MLNWAKPEKAMITVGGTLALAIIVHITLFWIYKLRVFVQRRFFGTNLILPTTAPPTLKTSSSIDSRISMVFGAQNGITNEAFRSSADKVCS